MIRPSLAVLALCCSLVAPLLARPASADGAWLDQSPPAGWNLPGAPVPAAPTPAAPLDPRCAPAARPAETPADGAVAVAGWTLFGTYLGGWGVQVVRGLAGYDGMCRPLHYQEFVFVDGAFAGTISPASMDDRADGSGEVLTLGEGGTQLTATFRRYAPSDPLCCPSATSSVTYRIERAPARLVPESVTTTQLTPPAPLPGAGPPAAPCPGPTASSERITVCLASGIGSGVQGRSVPRSPQPGPGATEAHRLLVIQGYPVPVPGATPLDPASLTPLLPAIAVFNLGDFEQPGAFGAQRVQALRQLLQDRPPFSGVQGLPPGTVSLPQLAAPGLVTPFTAKPAYLDLPWGAGVRGIVQAGQGFSPPQNGHIQYQFAGLSSDNRWLVVATFPVAVPGLPAVPQTALATNPQAAIAPVQVHLSLLDESRYTPILAVLDAALQALQLAP